MNGKNTKSEADPYLIGMILLQVLIGMFVGLLIWYVFGLRISISIPFGLAVWTVALLGTGVVNSFFVEITEFSGAVFINQFRCDKLPMDAKQSIDSLEIPTSSIREVSAGYHGKWPWERVNAVDLKRHIVVTSVIKAYTGDNIEVQVEWVATLTPLKGYLVNYLRWSEDARKAYFEGAFQAHIITVIKTLKNDALFGKIADKNGDTTSGLDFTKKKFNAIFGGKNSSSPQEEKFGTFTNDPTIKRIEPSAKYQNAAESVRIAEETNKAIGMFPETIDRRVAAAAVLGSQDIDTVRTFQFIGKIEGLKKNTNIVVPGVGNIFGEEDKNKKKGK